MDIKKNSMRNGQGSTLSIARLPGAGKTVGEASKFWESFAQMGR